MSWILGIFCRHGNIDVECEGEEYHTMPWALEHDRKRNNKHGSYGWQVLRFSGQDIEHDKDETLQTIHQTIKNLGGLDPHYREV